MRDPINLILDLADRFALPTRLVIYLMVFLSVILIKKPICGLVDTSFNSLNTYLDATLDNSKLVDAIVLLFVALFELMIWLTITIYTIYAFITILYRAYVRG